MTEAEPGVIFSILDDYRANANSDMILKIETKNERILIEDSKKNLKISLKFYQVGCDEERNRYKVRFIKKSGSIAD